VLETDLVADDVEGTVDDSGGTHAVLVEAKAIRRRRQILKVVTAIAAAARTVAALAVGVSLGLRDVPARVCRDGPIMASGRWLLSRPGRL
jgi:hypothetical protein